MANDFNFILLQIYVSTNDEDLIDTINTLLDNKNESHRMNEMPYSDQVGEDINCENFPNLKEGDLQSEIDNLVEYVDKTAKKYLHGYKTTIPIRHIQKRDILENKIYHGDVYLCVGNCNHGTNNILQLPYYKQQGLYHMKYGGHWNECQEALTSKNIEKFKTCTDIDFGINRDEHNFDKTKLEVHTGNFTYIVALATSDLEETVLLTVYKETTKERNKRRAIELRKGRN